MKLKELVPPLELCKLIPAGEFEQSALCWIDKEHAAVLPTDIASEQQPFIELRRYTIQGDEIPAPTLQEIIAELPPTDSCVGYFCIYQGDNEWSIGDCELDLYMKNGTEDSNPATAALQVWLKLKGNEIQ